MQKIEASTTSKYIAKTFKQVLHMQEKHNPNLQSVPNDLIPKKLDYLAQM